MAARTPFARAAEGARLPDGNPNTTATFALTRKINLVSNATGELDVTVLPCLATAAFTTRGSISGGELLSLANTGVAANTYYEPVTSAGKTGVGFPTNDLSAQYTKFRIVAYGARLRLASGVNTTGEFTAAVMPLKGLAPPIDSVKPLYVDYQGFEKPFSSYSSALGPRNNFNAYLDALGIPFSFGADANAGTVELARLPNIPSHATMSASEVAARGAHVRGLPFESASREYKSMAFKAIGLDCQDVCLYNGNSASATYLGQQLGGDFSAYRVGGHESLILGGSSFPASTTVASLELIYHVEAIPNPQYALLARPTSAIPLVPPSETLDNVLTKLHRLPRISFADVVTYVGDAMLGEVEGRTSAAAASGLSSLAGALARLAM